MLLGMSRTLPTAVVAQAGRSGSGDMVLVPAGPFVAGVAKGQPGATEWPLQTVQMAAAFLIDRTEVTNAAFAEFLKSHPEWTKGKVDRTQAIPPYLSQFSGTTVAPGKENLPVVFVSWFAANAFCTASGKRLPTAAEWEKAARGTDGRPYPWGSTLDGKRANFCDAKCGMYYRDSRYDDGHERLAPVGQYPEGASPYGLLDMSGNASEWVSDWLDRTNGYYQHLPPNPKGPPTGRSRVFRGGSYLDNDKVQSIYPSYYYGFRPNTTAENLGFRCAKDAPR